MHRRIIGSTLGLLLLLGTAAWAQTGPATLSVEKIHAKPAMQQAMQRAGKGNSLDRVTEAFDSQLLDRINSSRKFRVTAVSDLATLLKAVNRTNQSTETKTLTYGLIVTLDDFEDSTEQMNFPSLNQVGVKRKIRLSAVAKIYNLGIDPPELFETANIQVLQAGTRMDMGDLQKNAELTDALLLTSVQEAAQKIVDRVTDVVYPAKIMTRTDRQITINRGDGTGIAPGQLWTVFALGKALKDPDTGEVLGREEFVAGTARILSVQAKFTTAEVVDGGDRIREGMLLRLPAAPPPPPPPPSN